MTPKEELFSKLFNSHKPAVSAMDDDELRAHIEELEGIAFQAKACLYAAGSEVRERIAKGRKAKGINVVVPGETEEIINSIADRQKKKSKEAKEIERLMKLGIDRETAEKMYSSVTINALKKKKPGEKIDMDRIKKAEITVESIRGKCPTCLEQFAEGIKGDTVCSKCGTKCFVTPVIKVSNPFDKKPVVSETVTETETATKTEPVIEITEGKKEERPKLINPFASK